jgi:hypothetical protein
MFDVDVSIILSLENWVRDNIKITTNRSADRMMIRSDVSAISHPNDSLE